MARLYFAESDIDMAKSARYFYKGALLGDGSCTTYYLSMLRSRPREIIPWGNWEPELHLMLPDSLKKLIFTWMMIAKRHKMAKDATILIIVFIVSKPYNLGSLD